MNKQHKRENIIWVSLIPQIAILVVAIIWIYLVPKDNVLVYFTFNYKHALIGVFAGLIISLSGFLFYKFCEKTKMFYETVELFENIMGPIFKNLNLFDILTLSFVAAFCEEVFFRGLLQQKIGIILASLAFGLLHLPGKKYWIYALWATGSGIVLGLLLIYTGSLWVPIIAHASNNIAGMFLLKKVSKR